jgi:hypothetical protein
METLPAEIVMGYPIVLDDNQTGAFKSVLQLNLFGVCQCVVGAQDWAGDGNPYILYLRLRKGFQIHELLVHVI